MSWAISVFRGDPDDLDHEERFAPLDLERARKVIHTAGAPVDEAGRQILIACDATFTDVALVLDGHGTLRALEAEIYFDDPPGAVVRAELRDLLALFFTLGEELAARVFDHDSRSFVTPADEEALLDLHAALP